MSPLEGSLGLRLVPTKTAIKLVIILSKMILVPTDMAQSTFKESPTRCLFLTQLSWLRTREVTNTQSNDNNNHRDSTSLLGSAIQ